jgi:hypothetical protein
MDSPTLEDFSIDELATKFPRQWLGVKVLERENEAGQPVRVEVICKNVDLYSVRSMLGPSYCTIYTGPIPEVKHVAMF